VTIVFPWEPSKNPYESIESIKLEENKLQSAEFALNLYSGAGNFSKNSQNAPNNNKTLKQSKEAKVSRILPG